MRSCLPAEPAAFSTLIGVDWEWATVERHEVPYGFFGSVWMAPRWGRKHWLTNPSWPGWSPSSNPVPADCARTGCDAASQVSPDDAVSVRDAGAAASGVLATSSALAAGNVTGGARRLRRGSTKNTRPTRPIPPTLVNSQPRMHGQRHLGSSSISTSRKAPPASLNEEGGGLLLDGEGRSSGALSCSTRTRRARSGRPSHAAQLRPTATTTGWATDQR
jgi:hypothetical protein